MSGIVGSKFNHRGSGLIGSLGTDGQHMLSSGAGKKHVFETVAAAAATDLTPVRQDILTLALKQAVQENSTKFNLPNSSIVQFEADADFDLAGSTDVERSSDETISTRTWAAAAEVAYTNTDLTLINEGSGDVTKFNDDNVNTYGYFKASPSGYDTGWSYDHTTAAKWTKVRWYQIATSGRLKNWKFYTSDDGSDWTEQDMTGSDSSTGTDTSPLVAADTDTWNTGTLTTPALARYHKIVFDDHYAHVNSTCGATEYEMFGQAATVNATGTALGTTNVPTSAVTDVSGVMLLQDAYGTTTLGTDVKAYFTADNSAWTEADSYTDAGTFSTGIKMIKLGKTTCTEGSDVRWKIVWANQSASSKEGYIYGIGLNY